MPHKSIGLFQFFTLVRKREDGFEKGDKRTATKKTSKGKLDFRSRGETDDSSSTTGNQVDKRDRQEIILAYMEMKDFYHDVSNGNISKEA